MFGKPFGGRADILAGVTGICTDIPFMRLSGCGEGLLHWYG